MNGEIVITVKCDGDMYDAHRYERHVEMEIVESWLRDHPEDANLSLDLLVKKIFHHAIDNTIWAEEAYPGIKERMHKKVDETQI